MSPPTQTQTAIAPDGRRVTISCRTMLLHDIWHWQMLLTSSTAAVGVSVTPADYVDVVIPMLQVTVTQEVSYRTRPFLVGVDAESGNWFAGWKGVHHCLTMGGPTPAPDLATLTGLLDQLSITDTPEGLVMIPVSGSTLRLWSLCVTKYADAGLITIYPRAEANALVPLGEGKSVEHGQVWIKGLDVNGELRGRMFVHVGQTAIATIDDDLDLIHEVTRAGQEDLISSLDVRWDA